MVLQRQTGAELLFEVFSRRYGHSSIDFSLQIPGFAIVVFAIVGVGLAQSFDTAPSRHYRNSEAYGIMLTWMHRLLSPSRHPALND
jgi:hypothetical protein